MIQKIINFDNVAKENIKENNPIWPQIPNNSHIIERIWQLIITIDDKIRDDKLQYDINREAAKISALSPGKIGRYEYLAGEKILPPDQKRVMEWAQFAYFPLGKAFEKQLNIKEKYK